MTPFRTRDKDVVCANGGGGLHPPSKPPVSFYAVQAFFQEHCIINKTCIARIFVIHVFKYHRAGSLFANWGGDVPPNPRAFLSCARPRQVSSCQQNRTHIWTLSEPMTKRLCLQMGGAAPPQSSPLSFYAVQACFQEHRTISWLHAHDC